MHKLSIKKTVLVILLLIITMGYLTGRSVIIPVKGATPHDWNHASFWYEPWGASGVHKGIDIFARTGTPAIASTSGLVVYSGTLGLGGNVVVYIGPKWRIYYYAHLDQIQTSPLSWLSQGEPLGTVGSTGNAAGKPPHLHFSVFSIVPLPWRFSSQTQGWKKIFFLNPMELFTS